MLTNILHIFTKKLSIVPIVAVCLNGTVIGLLLIMIMLRLLRSSDIDIKASKLVIKMEAEYVIIGILAAGDRQCCRISSTLANAHEPNPLADIKRTSC